MILFVLLGAALAGTPDLDAPLPPDRPTLRSEIQRGAEAAEFCRSHARRGEREDEGLVIACAQDAAHANRQRLSQGYAPFDAGLWSWTRAMLKISYDLMPSPYNKSNLDLAEAALSEARSRAHLTDADIARATKRD